jgi:hypothetical protein
MTLYLMPGITSYLKLLDIQSSLSKSSETTDILLQGDRIMIPLNLRRWQLEGGSTIGPHSAWATYYLVVIAGNLSCDHPARDLKVEEYLPFLRVNGSIEPHSLLGIVVMVVVMTDHYGQTTPLNRFARKNPVRAGVGFPAAVRAL